MLYLHSLNWYSALKDYLKESQKPNEAKLVQGGQQQQYQKCLCKLNSNSWTNEADMPLELELASFYQGDECFFDITAFGFSVLIHLPVLIIIVQHIFRQFSSNTDKPFLLKGNFYHR